MVGLFLSRRLTFLIRMHRCEYIFYRGLYRTSYMRMSRGKVTDTELQAGQFVVPRFGYGVTNESKAARYLRNYKETLGEAHVSGLFTPRGNFFLLTPNIIIVVPDGILWRRKKRRKEWSFLSCIWYTPILQHPRGCDLVD